MAVLVVPSAMAVVVAIYMVSALPVLQLVLAVVMQLLVKGALRVFRLVFGPQLLRWVLFVEQFVFRRLVRQVHYAVLLASAVVSNQLVRAVHLVQIVVIL
jgi:hypothetical protein